MRLGDTVEGDGRKQLTFLCIRLRAFSVLRLVWIKMLRTPLGFLLSLSWASRDSDDVAGPHIFPFRKGKVEIINLSKYGIFPSCKSADFFYLSGIVVGPVANPRAPTTRQFRAHTFSDSAFCPGFLSLPRCSVFRNRPLLVPRWGPRIFSSPARENSLLFPRCCLLLFFFMLLSCLDLANQALCTDSVP